MPVAKEPSASAQHSFDGKLGPSFRAYAVLLSAQLAVGAAAIFARFALHGTGPITASALRLTIAALPLLVYSWPLSRRLALPGKHEALLAFAGVCLALHFSTWIGSLLYTSVATSTLLVSTAPVWTALYDALILKHAVDRRFWLALFAGACGVMLIAMSKSSTAPIVGLESFGDLLAMTGGIAFAAYLIAVRSISNLYPTAVIVGRTYSWGALGLWGAASFANQPSPGDDLISWGGILAMAVVSQMLGHTGINASLRWFSSSTVAFSTLLEPVFAAGLAAIVFSESLSIQTVCGCLVVLSSIAVILRLQMK